jgi:hypothetical protein
MQLAILLSLIQTRGGSLPDKRTALYDNYVELFFNRESEKSDVVRDHRDLLIDIHRYLAWVLHAESQTKQDRGSVTADRLRELVTDYLRKGAIADRLYGQRLIRNIRKQSLSVETAEEIMRNADQYPADLGAFAEQFCRERVAEKIDPVGRVAEAQHWFHL